MIVCKQEGLTPADQSGDVCITRDFASRNLLNSGVSCCEEGSSFGSLPSSRHRLSIVSLHRDDHVPVLSMSLCKVIQ
jgi:hypothetical protein